MSKLTFAGLLARSFWQAPGSTEIRVSLVVGGTSTEIMEGFDAIPRSGRPAEVGGILLGRSGKNEIVVDGFEPVLCEHRFGPFFRLSDSDRIAWRETVQRIRRREELAIIGWYRTDTREEFALSEDDRELLETELHQDGDVILLIKPTQSQPCEAKVFIRDDEQLREVPQATYFAFDRRASSVLRPSSAEPLVKENPLHPWKRHLVGSNSNFGIPLMIWNFSIPAMTVPPVRLRRQHLSSTMDPNLLLLAGRLLGNLKSLFLLRPTNANLNILLPLRQPPKVRSQLHRFRVNPHPFVSQTLHCYPAKRQSLGLSSSPLGRSPVGDSSRSSSQKNGRVAS